ncbi:hypothetical protein ANN_25191 [Periplaneta americana]|uniref:Endonuclease-reverse transcriptase n=1 Tax=Periplaneta americana TaxID=6978 RepID=A0ABQ8S0M0_PERAM|nr:hypothetical protein ANN_25191 [Periplaneta americana]
MRPRSSTESYPAFARIGLRENLGKNLNQIVLRRLGKPSKAVKLISPRQPGKTAVRQQATRVGLMGQFSWDVATVWFNWNNLQRCTSWDSSAVRIYKTVILPVVPYGCETWTLTLREEHRLRVFENKVLRKIFGAKKDEVTGEWRKLHNTELHALYSSADIIRNIKSRRLKWAGHVARMGESRNAYRVLVGRPEGKRPLGRQRRRWDNIKMDLREVGYDDRD